MESSGLASRDGRGLATGDGAAAVAKEDALKVLQTIQESEVGVIFPAATYINAEDMKHAKILYETYDFVRKMYQEAAMLLGSPFQTNVSPLDFWFRNPEQYPLSKFLFQIALTLRSTALYQVFEKERGRPFQPAAIAGYSIGLLPALVQAKAITVEDALFIMKQIEESHRKVEITPGPYGYIAMNGVEFRTIEPFLIPGQVELIIDASPYYLVIIARAKHQDGSDLRQLKERISRYVHQTQSTGRKSIRLTPIKITHVSHHTFFGSKVKDDLRSRIATLEINDPIVQTPIIRSSSPSGFLTTAEDVRRELEQFLFEPIYWTDTLRRMSFYGAKATMIMGPGPDLKNYNKQLAPHLTTVEINEHQPLLDTAAAISASIHGDGLADDSRLERRVKTVWVVNSEDRVRINRRQQFKAIGYDVRTFSTGKRMLGALKKQTPDLILLDFKLDGMSGLEVLKAMPNTRSVPVVMDRQGRKGLADFARHGALSFSLDRRQDEQVELQHVLERVEVWYADRKGDTPAGDGLESYLGVSSEDLQEEFGLYRIARTQSSPEAVIEDIGTWVQREADLAEAWRILDAVGIDQFSIATVGKSSFDRVQALLGSLERPPLYKGAALKEQDQATARDMGWHVTSLGEALVGNRRVSVDWLQVVFEHSLNLVIFDGAYISDRWDTRAVSLQNLPSRLAEARDVLWDAGAGQAERIRAALIIVLSA